jgi:hypothetical protein
VISDPNCRTISELQQRMVMEQPVPLQLGQESLQPVQELCWLLHKQRPILRRQAYHKLGFRRPEFRRLVRHMLAHSTLVRKNHILASGSLALEVSASAFSALAMKA